MPQAPIFSIIIPVYNVKQYLGTCLDSLVQQTFQDFEAIIVDDVSNDGSKDIALSYAQRFPEHFKVILHEVNTRQGGARNTGIGVAAGQYLMFLDSDDYLTPNALEVLHRAMEERNAPILEFCQQLVDEQGRPLRKDQWPGWLDTAKPYPQPLLVSGMGPCNKVYRRELFFQPDIRFPLNHFYEDYWTVPKLLLRSGQVSYLHDALYCYRQRTGSTTHSKDVSHNRDVLLGTDELLTYFKANSMSEAQFAELEFLAVTHLLINATLRISCIDWRSPLQQEILTYMQTHFPNWKNNPYLGKLDSRKRRLMQLIAKEQHLLVHILWCQRNNLSGWVKRMIKR